MVRHKERERDIGVAGSLRCQLKQTDGGDGDLQVEAQRRRRWVWALISGVMAEGLGKLGFESEMRSGFGIPCWEDLQAHGFWVI
ncbi:hypothetical protein M0R45_006724 [Rubus argutus]|uniref:Uncharacterized protein n=1 Tax=Rubus argutus TaxID=59490 RepID=A0AAW1YRP8_RUBAR